MKYATLAVLILLNLLGVGVLSSSVFIAVHGAVKQSDIPVTLVLVLFCGGALAPVLTAGVLFKTQLVSSGNTWKEIVEDLRPLLPWGRKAD